MLLWCSLSFSLKDFRVVLAVSSSWVTQARFENYNVVQFIVFLLVWHHFWDNWDSKWANKWFPSGFICSSIKERQILMLMQWTDHSLVWVNHGLFSAWYSKKTFNWNLCLQFNKPGLSEVNSSLIYFKRYAHCAVSCAFPEPVERNALSGKAGRELCFCRQIETALV